MIKTLIVEDEGHCVDRLQGLLTAHHGAEVKLLPAAETVQEALHHIEAYRPGLVLLDVQIGDRTGFDLLRECGPINFKIIFTTAYDQFAIQAIKYSAIDYLLKPIDEADLAEALQKLTATTVEQTSQMARIIEKNLSLPAKKRKLTIPTGKELLFVDIEDIVRCHSDINYTTIYTRDKQKLVVAKTLKEFEELLSEHDFFRIHNSDLINLTFIKSYTRGKGGSVMLLDGTPLEVSTRRRDEFLKKMAAL